MLNPVRRLKLMVNFALGLLPGRLMEWILTFATDVAAGSQGSVKIQNPLETYICSWFFDSNIRKSDSRDGMRMLETDHWYVYRQFHRSGHARVVHKAICTKRTITYGPQP